MMDEVSGILRATPELVLVWRVIIYLCALYLMLLAAVIFFRRDWAMAFFGGFASTPNLNAIEVALRFLAGIAFMGVASETRFPEVSFYFGLFLAVSALAMLPLYRMHKRFADVVMKALPAFLPLMGLGSLIFAGLIIYGIN